MLEEQAVTPRRRSMRRWIGKLGWVVVPVALVGEAGHQLLEHLGRTMAHHFFHLVFPGVAAILFAGYVLIDVRRYGWPAFSWRLSPSSPGPRSAVEREPVSAESTAIGDRTPTPARPTGR